MSPDQNEIRDQLAALVSEHVSYDHREATVNAILAAGWRPPARVITTTEELDALPDATIIRARFGTVAQKSEEAWEFPNEVGRYLGEVVDLPAAVLWTPQNEPDPSPELQPVTPACDTFKWVGQSFAHCDGCGLPYWEHTYDYVAGPDPFAEGGKRLISSEEKASCRVKWGTCDA